MGLLNNVPCVNRPTAPVMTTNNATLLGSNRIGCRWVWMDDQGGGGHWQLVCFHGEGGAAPYNINQLRGTTMIQHPAATNANLTITDTLPYCDTIGITDEISYFIQQNPLLAAGIGLAAALLIYTFMKK